MVPIPRMDMITNQTTASDRRKHRDPLGSMISRVSWTNDSRSDRDILQAGRGEELAVARRPMSSGIVGGRIELGEG